MDKKEEKDIRETAILKTFWKTEEHDCSDEKKYKEIDTTEMKPWLRTDTGKAIIEAGRILLRDGTIERLWIWSSWL